MNVFHCINRGICLLPLLSAISVKAEETPNIIFILADDLGYSDLGFLGQKQVHTPNIDQLASEGLYFSDAYAAAPVSSPTRASIISGKSPAEVKLTCHIPGMGMQTYIKKLSAGRKNREAFFVDHLDPKDKTIGALLKDAGDNTAFMTGIMYPYADNELLFSVQGGAEILGIDNGDPIDLSDYKTVRRRIFRGKTMLWIRSNGQKEDIIIKVTSQKLKTAELVIPVKK